MIDRLRPIWPLLIIFASGAMLAAAVFFLVGAVLYALFATPSEHALRVVVPVMWTFLGAFNTWMTISSWRYRASMKALDAALMAEVEKLFGTGNPWNTYPEPDDEMNEIDPK